QHAPIRAAAERHFEWRSRPNLIAFGRPACDAVRAKVRFLMFAEPCRGGEPAYVPGIPFFIYIPGYFPMKIITKSIESCIPGPTSGPPRVRPRRSELISKDRRHRN